MGFYQYDTQADGVHEPEAAGAYAWLLYHAYNETGNEEYLRSAEWSMEYLSNLGRSIIRLQLPYGAYAAARMNAELGTEYDVENFSLGFQSRTSQGLGYNRRHVEYI